MTEQALAPRREDDGYGRHWDYRVFSQLDTNPDNSNAGGRYLAIRAVHYAGHPVSRPAPSEVESISSQPAQPSGGTLEELLLDLDRIQRALDQPALVLAEWLDLVEIPRVGGADA